MDVIHKMLTETNDIIIRNSNKLSSNLDLICESITRINWTQLCIINKFNKELKKIEVLKKNIKQQKYCSIRFQMFKVSSNKRI